MMGFPRFLSLIISGCLAICLMACSNSGGDDADSEEPDVESEEDADVEEPVDPPPECETWGEEPAGLLLTWQRDPTSTMTIDWHVESDDDVESRTDICFREAGADDWTHRVDAEHIPVLYDYDHRVYRTELHNLEPGSEYVFQVGEFGREYRFRTMPADIDGESVTFAAGGDTMHLPQLFEETNRAVMEYDLDFIVWGGDLAYADGGEVSAPDRTWEMWFETIIDSLIYDDGRVLPIVVAIGNHEVRQGYTYRYDDYEQTDQWRRKQAPYFYSFFAFPDHPGYGVLDFGEYMSLIALDTDHSNPVEGLQTQWLESTIAERYDRGVTHILPVYHVAAFPSHRDFDEEIPAQIREHWVPLFEEYGVRMAFENHDHTYKRTHPIRGGEIDEDGGIVYIGDGAWGVFPRSGSSQNEWYMKQFAGELHGIVVTLHGDDQHALVVNMDKEVIDEYGTRP